VAEQHTHWKAAFPTDYFGHQHMPEGNDMIVQIKEVKQEAYEGKRGKEGKLIAHITAEPEKWILNKTNAKTIEKVLGTGYIEEWAGHKIQLYVTKTSSPEGLVDCVRVREFPVKE